jgi:nicotinamidase-related amidase
MTNRKQLPIPSFFDPKKADEVYLIDYAGIEQEALEVRRKYGVELAAADTKRICVMPIDMQIGFCSTKGQLFVGGRSGRGAIDDNIRTAEFIYRDAAIITEIDPTMDTHSRYQIFHPAFWVNDKGEFHKPHLPITVQDVESGTWKVNPETAAIVGGNYVGLQAYALHYVRELKAKGRYDLTIWPYHTILGGVSHALSPIIEEAVWYHNCLRGAQTGIQIKGGSPLSENYSVLGPEVRTGADGKPMLQKNVAFIKTLVGCDRLIIPGQAKSHCVAWTIADLLDEIKAKDPKLAGRVYLLEDCTSAVVVPGVVDYTDEADAAFKKFADEGMHVVKSTTPIDQWPDF